MSTITEDVLRRELHAERILLVGGAGFIGHNLALGLRRLGAPVMVADNLGVNNMVDNLVGDAPDPLLRACYQNFLIERFELMREAGVEMRNADARQIMDLTRIFREYQPTRVVHMAAIASAVTARNDPGLCFDLQLVTLRNVLELARLHPEPRPSVVLMSSSTVYGDFETPRVDEAVRPRPYGIYANTKYMAERLARTYRYNHGVLTTIARPSALYGERCVSRRVSQVFIENALLGKPLRLEGGGEGRLDFTYIEDLVDGLVRVIALNKDMGSYSTYNLTYGGARTIAELAGVVKDLVPGVVIEEAPRACDKPVRGTLSIERARDVLGFAPKWPLEAGYRRYCEWYMGQWEKVWHRRRRG